MVYCCNQDHTTRFINLQGYSEYLGQPTIWRVGMRLASSPPPVEYAILGRCPVPGSFSLVDCRGDFYISTTWRDQTTSGVYFVRYRLAATE